MTRLNQAEHASRLLKLIRTKPMSKDKTEKNREEILHAFTVKALSLKPRTLLKHFFPHFFSQ